MDLPDLSGLGALGIPAFVAIFLMGWKARELTVEKPIAKRMEALEAEVEDYRKAKDAELLALRQKVLG